MNAYKKNDNSFLACLSVMMLLGAAILGWGFVPGIIAAPGDVDEPIWDPVNITASIDADISFVYNTTMDQNITLTWSYADPLPADGHLSDVMVGISDYDSFEEEIYIWNLTADGGSPLGSAIWNHNGSLPPGDYFFGIVVKFWNETDQVYTMDISDVMLEIADGTGLINSFTSEPATVINDGASEVHLTLNISRLMSEVDHEFSNIAFWNEDAQMWSDLEFTDPDPANISETDHTTVASVNLTIPLDFPVGEYYVWFHLVDIWGYMEDYNASIFTVEWYDRPLQESEDTTILVNEDEMMATFDPLSFFHDPDGPVDLVVSLGYDEVTNETTDETVNVPIWFYEDENITIELNQTDLSSSMAWVNMDVEEGRWAFETTAWVDGEPVLDGMAYVEIVPVNDIPVLNVENVVVYKNRPITIDLSTLFDDPDGPEFNLTVNTTVSGALLTYDWETFMLTINPATNWTGSIDVELNVTDGVDHAPVTLPVEVMLMPFEISGTVTIEEGDLNLTLTNITLTIGGQVVAINTTTGVYSVVLNEDGNYTVAISIEEEFLYNEANETDGYVVPTLDNIVLTGDTTLDITIEWMEYVPSTPVATWDDIDFENWKIKEDDDLMIVTVPVMNESLAGFEDIEVILVIIDGDEEIEFPMIWETTDKVFIVELDEDELENVSEGDVDFYFKGAGEDKTVTYSGEFKEKDENANLITVIVLIILIILVLIALVFIMRKPSEEEFDEEEEEEEEGDRTCPSCGETISDEEASECPYCGEGLEE